MLTLSTKADLTMKAARAKLRPPRRREGVMPALGAAALAAVSALVLAGAVILGPPWEAHATPVTSTLPPGGLSGVNAMETKITLP